MGRRGIAILLGALGALTAVGGPATAAAVDAGSTAALTSPDTAVGPGDPLGLLRDYEMLRSISLGADSVAVVRCRVPADTTDDLFRTRLARGTTSARPATVAQWMTTNVAPYFTEVSGGRMTMTFHARGTVTLDRDDGEQDCRLKAAALAAETDSNLIAYDTTLYAGGMAGAGWWECAATGCIFAAERGDSSRTSGRGGWVGGGSVGTLPWVGISVVAHELGHTLGWPHSFKDPWRAYDNRYDLMSRSAPDCDVPTPDSWCIRDAQHTLAINRYTAGWIPTSAVRVVETGPTTVDLAAPLRRGLQLAIVRLTSTTMLTIEARPRAGRDLILPRAGVAVHRVDVGSCTTDDLFLCRVGTERIHVPTTNDIPAGGHVLSPGQARTISGVRIEVLTTAGSGYRVRITPG